MARARRTTVWILALLAVAAVAERQASADGYLDVHVGFGNVGFTVGAYDWGVYGDAWYESSWNLDFNGALADYGEWVWVNGLGRCWRPWVTTGWRPYTHGRWVLTPAGWTWVAFEPWGYVPHHYGNWAYMDFGWVWVPGTAYVGANVVWVRAGGYLGWYARPPHGWSHAAHGFRRGFERGYRTGYGDGYRDGWLDARYATWVEWKHFGSDNIAHRTADSAAVTRHRLEGGVAAPTAADVRRHGGGEVATSRLETRTVRSNGREITVARPAGVRPSVERHAEETVRSALATSSRQRLQAPPAGRQTSSAAAETQSAHGRSRTPSSAATVQRSPQTRPDALRVPGSANPGTSAVGEVRPNAGTRHLGSGRAAAPRAPVQREGSSARSAVPSRSESVGRSPQRRPADPTLSSQAGAVLGRPVGGPAAPRSLPGSERRQAAAAPRGAQSPQGIGSRDEPAPSPQATATRGVQPEPRRTQPQQSSDGSSERRRATRRSSGGGS